MTLLRRIFGVDKPIIAMLHLPAMPGRPRHDRSLGMRHLVETVEHDLESLQAAGVDGFLFCNEADLPYQMQVGPEVAAGMAAVIGQVRDLITRPFGVDLVWDPMAEPRRGPGNRRFLFVREVFTGVFESDCPSLYRWPSFSVRRSLSIPRRNTFAPNDFATSIVRSVEPESTTMISPLSSAISGCTLASARPMLAFSLKLIMTTESIMGIRVPLQNSELSHERNAEVRRQNAEALAYGVTS